MQNVAPCFFSSSPLRIRVVGLTCLVASMLIAGAVASAEPHFAADSGAAIPAKSTVSAEPAPTSPSVAGGGPGIKSNRDDTLCPWGRLGDGRGTLVRCLTVDEARTLAKSAKGETETGAGAATVTSEEPTAIVAVVNSVVFEGESILSAKQNLASLAPDYQSCVARHGGLRHEAGEVRIRFHIDSRGVARDASVSRRRVVSMQAATCVAGIVGHRFVGVPKSKASVGTLVIHFARRVK